MQMHKVIVSSRTFGKVVSIGEELLRNNGFAVFYARTAPGTLIDEDYLAELVKREQPYAIICGTEPITRKVLESSQNLRIVMKRGVGIDNIDLQTATSLNIAVGNAPEANKKAVAELTLGLILVLVRHLYDAIQSTKSGKWIPFIGHELNNLTIGVIGTGRIGREVIKLLHGFGAKILAYDIMPNNELAMQYGVKYVSLDTLLKMSDIVTIHAPLTKETHHMIGQRELEMMKPSAFIINTARGEIIDEVALYNHLKEKKIAGAALDVFSQEPPLNNPILNLDNVIATPHMGAYTFEAMEKMDRICAETIIAFSRGEKLSNIINADMIFA
jgi:D-3-phosphoglycerate dehydrogenase